MKDLKPKYVLYARKSTEDDGKQVMSIEAQLFELREYARREHLEILAEFQESKSAKTPGREQFSGTDDGCVVERERTASGILWRGTQTVSLAIRIDGGRIVYAVDTQKCITSLRFPTFWFEPTPQGKFMLQVAFGQSKYYSDNLGRKT
jgi:site-specific DNA recombinase